MDIKTEELNHSPQINSAYAEQWLAYLQKRNATFGVVWPLLLTLSVILLVAALYFFQQEKIARQRIEQVLAQVGELNSKAEASLMREKILEQQKAELMQEIESLKNLQKSLEEQKGESISRLDLTSQMAETLKQQIAAIDAEKEQMSKALIEAKELLLQQETDRANLETQNSAIVQQLNERTVGFEALLRRQKETQAEVDRLADKLNRQTAESDAFNTQREQLRSQLKESDRQLTLAKQQLAETERKREQLQLDYDKLDRSLKQMVAPILESDKQKNTVPSIQNTPKPALTPDGLDEIRAPIAH